MVASTAGPWLRDPLGDELRQRPMLRLAFGNPGFVLLVLSLRRLFKTDAALSGVLPNPLSPAGYFPSEAIYLLHFRRKLQSLIFFFFPPTPKGLPALPNNSRGQHLPKGTGTLLGSGCQAPCPTGDGVAGLGGLLQCCLTFIDSFLFIIEREMAPDFSPCAFFPMRFLWGGCPPRGMPAAHGLGLEALF